jgi:hypothetical protein
MILLRKKTEYKKWIDFFTGKDHNNLDNKDNYMNSWFQSYHHSKKYILVMNAFAPCNKLFFYII